MRFRRRSMSRRRPIRRGFGRVRTYSRRRTRSMSRRRSVRPLRIGYRM